MTNKLNEVVFKKDKSGAWRFFTQGKIGTNLTIEIYETANGWGYDVSYDGLDEDDPRVKEDAVKDITINTSSFDLLSGGYPRTSIVKIIKKQLRIQDGRMKKSILTEVANSRWKFSQINHLNEKNSAHW